MRKPPLVSPPPTRQTQTPAASPATSGGLRSFIATAAALVLVGSSPAAQAQQSGDQKWVATWSTASATSFTYTPPVAPVAPNTVGPATIQPDLGFAFPLANTEGATDQTFRSIVKPDLWGNTMRFRFSNVFGARPVTFNHVKAGVQSYNANVLAGTNTEVTFNGGRRSVTIPVGQEVFSDAVQFTAIKGASDPLVLGRNLAVSYSVQGASGPMTFHAAAHGTNYVTPPGSGDHTEDANHLAFEFTTTSWFFLNAVDVMAPTNTVVICALGDSITDGTHVTLNGNDRWMDVLSRRLHKAYGNRVSIVNEGIGGNRVVNPTTAGATSGPAAVDRLDRDVLGLSGLTHVIWLEGINDIGGGRTPEEVIAGYQDVVGRLHARGIKVVGATLTSALGVTGTTSPTADNGPLIDAKRLTLNSFIRTSGLFDAVADFDAATIDPNTGNLRPAYLPNSEFTQLPLDYLHPNRAGYMAMGQSVDLGLFAPR